MNVFSINQDRVEDRVSEVLYEYCNGEDAAFIDLAFEIDSLQQQLSSTKQELESLEGSYLDLNAELNDKTRQFESALAETERLKSENKEPN